MRTKNITSFVDFVTQTDMFDLLVDEVIFRGQGVKGNLIPSIARRDRTINTTEQEKEILRHFKRIGASLLPADETELDSLVRAQHYGLRTRLLDWTSNALAALWFACSDSVDGDVFVYALEVDDLQMTSDAYAASPFGVQKTRAFTPRMNNARVIAQHGWFTLHRYSRHSKRFVPLDRNPETSKYLHQYIIPADKRPEMLRALDRHGVSARTLFPDLQGICTYLNWKHPPL